MHSFNSCLMHCVFATKERRPWLTSAIHERLWPYLGGIARENDMKALAIGGVADHVHLLLSLPTTLSVAKAMQLVKAIPRNGCAKHFQSFAHKVSRGRKVLVRSASACRVWTTRF